MRCASCCVGGSVWAGPGLATGLSLTWCWRRGLPLGRDRTVSRTSEFWDGGAEVVVVVLLLVVVVGVVVVVVVVVVVAETGRHPVSESHRGWSKREMSRLLTGRGVGGQLAHRLELGERF